MGSIALHAHARRAASLLAFLAVAGSSAFASGVTAPGSPPGSTSATRIDHDRLYYDDSRADTVWVRGGTYKASFGVDGTAYVPLFGADAPRSFPVVFTLECLERGGRSIAFDARAVPARNGDTIVYDRGAVIEAYALTPASMEQSFTFASVPGHGDLVLRIGVESELDARPGGENLEFANALGTVRYGRALAIDADGATFDVRTVLDGASIELRLADAFLSHARFPLTIDPVISTFPILTSSADHGLPDVAYAVGSDAYLVVFEEQVSATDRDIFAVLLDPAGSVIIGGYVDMTSAFWADPSTASHRTSDRFLVAAEVGLPSSGTRTIRGRTVVAATFSMGAAFTISGAESGDKLNPDVGGDQDLIGSAVTYFCVVWERAVNATNHDIHARLVTSNGTLFGAGTILLDNSVLTLDAEPAISESSGAGAGGPKNWNIVWQREVSAADHDVHAAQISWTGAITTPSFAVVVHPSTDDTHPDVSSPLDNPPGGAGVPRFYLVVSERDTATSHLNIGWLMVEDGMYDQKNLTVLDGGLTFTDTRHPATDSDGDCFVVAYSELQSQGGTDLDVFVSTFAPVGTNLALSEGHLTLATSATVEDHADVVAEKSGGGDGPRFMVVWDDPAGGATLGDIEGALYDCGQFAAFCEPGSEGVIACPCGNQDTGAGITGCENSAGTGGAALAAAGAASVGGDTVSLKSTGEKPTALSIFTQGDLLVPAGVAFGQGVRCVGGSLKRLYTKSAAGGSASAPTGTDPSITARSAALGDTILPGESRWYFVYYRDATVLGGCSPASAFNVTSAVQAAWAP